MPAQAGVAAKKGSVTASISAFHVTPHVSDTVEILKGSHGES